MHTSVRLICLFACLGLHAVAAQSERYTIPLLVSAPTTGAPQGVLRILNGTDDSGTVAIYAISDAGTRSGPANFTLNASAAVQLTAEDLQSGNATLGLTGGIGTSVGDARLEIETDLSIVPLAFVRAADGTLSAMHDTVRAASVDGSDEYTYEVPVFNPSSEVTQVSRLRLINPGDAAAAVTISGRDDIGAAATGGDVTLTLSAGGAQTLTAQQLEAGDTAITGQLGAGTGKWRLTVSSDRLLQVLNIVAATAGYWNNLSTTAVPGAAPADLELLNERFVGSVVVFLTGGNRYTLDAQTGERFTETTETNGVTETDAGDYGYRGIGPEAGQLTLTYDDGDECGINLYFASRTNGWFASRCTGSDATDGTWSGGSWLVEVEEEDDGVAEVVDTTYGVDDALPGVPTSGVFTPANTGGGSRITATADGTTITLDEGGYFELSNGTRYTCATADGCTIVNGTVTAGTVTGSAPGSGEMDRFPTFRTATGPGNQSYTVGTAIATLALPEATGGNGTLTYSLLPTVPGLSFNATVRQLTGTPSTAGTYTMRYAVRDEDGDTDTLGFTITVEDDGVAEVVDTTYGVDDALPGVPTSGVFTPANTGGGSRITATADGTTITLDEGGYFELSNGTRYTCATADGCTIVNGTVTAGTVTGSAPGSGEMDRFPTFRTATGPGNQSYTVGTAIATLALPEATGGNGTLTYSLLPTVPGLSFNATVRQLTGTPSTAGTYTMRYAVRDEDGDTDTLGFTITVEAAGDSAEMGTVAVALSGCADGRYVADPGGNPGLVGDCRALVGFATALAEGVELPDNHILHQWGSGEQVRIDRWSGIGVSGGRVTQIRLGLRQLRGAIPPEIGELTALQHLNLGLNQLTGGIPPSIGNLTNLLELYLYANRLSGAIPPEIGQLTNLRRLILNFNQFTGTIPTELGRLNALQILGLGSNRLTGSIPAELGGLTSLVQLSLDGNELTGSISPELGRLAALEFLNLAGNGLSGAVPGELGALTNLNLLDLSSNELTDIAMLAANARWGASVRVDVSGNPLNDAAFATHIPALKGLGVSVNHDVRLVDEFPDSRLVQIHNDNVIVMQLDGGLTSPSTYISLTAYATDFFGWFEDEFDYLLFVSNLSSLERQSNFGYAGIYHPVMNDTEGIGLSRFQDSRYGSAGRLRGVVHFPFNTALRSGPSLHELLHAWANHTVPTAVRAHWGFSSANGQLGGFDIANLVDLGDGRWSAGNFGTFANYGNGVPYSPIELYFAGLVPREEVPDLWIAEDGQWLLDERGEPARTAEGDHIFIADNVRTLSIADIVAEHGERDPPLTERPHQRAAVILLVDDDHLLTADVLQTTSEHATWLSLQGNDEVTSFNYFEATGGRGTLTLAGLSELRKSEAAAPANLPASFGVVPPPRMTSFDELCGSFQSTGLGDEILAVQTHRRGSDSLMRDRHGCPLFP